MFQPVREPRRILALLLCCGTALALPGCNSGPGPTRTDAAHPAATGEPFDSLRTLARRQEQEPDARTAALPPPPGLAAADLEPGKLPDIAAMSAEQAAARFRE